MFKKSLLTDKFNLYSLMDSAIDKDKSNKEKYQETLDPQHLSFIEGSTPTVFVASPLTTRQKGKCVSHITTGVGYQELSDMITLAFRYGIRNIQNFQLGNGGAPLPLSFEETPEGPTLSLESLDQLQDPDLVFEIGQYILNLSHITPPFCP